MNRDEIVADLQATVDYAARITELADKFDFETNADVTDALERAKGAIEMSIAMLKAEQTRQLEAGERIHGGFRYYRTRKYTERTNHEVLYDAIVEDAALCDTPRQAARLAVGRMAGLFLSRSSNAKKGDVDKLSLARDAVFLKEYTGWKVEREVVPGAQET